MTWYEIIGAVGCLMVLAALVATCVYCYRSAAPLWRQPRERTPEERYHDLVARQLRRKARR